MNNEKRSQNKFRPGGFFSGFDKFDNSFWQFTGEEKVIPEYYSDAVHSFLNQEENTIDIDFEVVETKILK